MKFEVEPNGQIKGLDPEKGSTVLDALGFFRNRAVKVTIEPVEPEFPEMRKGTKRSSEEVRLEQEWRETVKEAMLREYDLSEADAAAIAKKLPHWA